MMKKDENAISTQSNEQQLNVSQTGNEAAIPAEKSTTADPDHIEKQKVEVDGDSKMEKFNTDPAAAMDEDERIGNNGL